MNLNQPAMSDDDPPEIVGNVHVFSLRLSSEMSGYDSPDNRFGVRAQGHNLIFPVYVIQREILEPWESDWGQSGYGTLDFNSAVYGSCNT